MKKLKKKLSSIIIQIAKKNLFLRFIIKKTRNTCYKIRYFLFYFIKYRVESNIILFQSFHGKKYADSPKAIYEELRSNEKYKSYIFVWALESEEYQELEKFSNTVVVKYNTKKYLEYYSRAKYIITNSRRNLKTIKKKKQIYVQTWHGTPLKRLAADIKVEGKNALNTIKELAKMYEDETRTMDYLISPSKFTSEKLKSAFNLKKFNKERIVVEEGYPRNDFLINYTKQDVEKTYKKLNINTDKKIILYAPTWRDHMHKAGVGYVYETEIDFEKLKKELSEEYIILYRAHYFIANTFDFDKYEGFIYNVSDIDDINDLYIISDILVTDYSSVFFDFANLKKSMLFFMYDLEEYREKARGFYIELEELPGPIVRTEEELIKSIKNIKEIKEKYIKKYKEFNEKFTYLDDGQASKRSINKIGI